MLRKVLILSAFAASLMSASALVSPADAAALRLPHPKPIGHKALPYRHGNISVANLPGHRPAYRHRRHRAHAKPHHPMKHHAKASKAQDKSMDTTKPDDKKPADQKPADAPKTEDKAKQPT